MPSLFRREAWERDQQAQMIAIRLGEAVYRVLGGDAETPESPGDQTQGRHYHPPAPARSVTGDPPEQLVVGTTFRTRSGKLARVVSSDDLIKAMSAP